MEIIVVSLILAFSLIIPAIGVVNVVGEKNISEEAQAAPGKMIHLKYAQFDPLARLPSIPPQLTAMAPFIPNTRMPFIVQTDGEMTEAWIEELTRGGAEIISYIPDNAYLVLAQENDAKSIGKLGSVRWMGEYHPAYKINENLNNAAGTVDVRILLFPDATNTYVVKLAKMVGAEIIGYAHNEQSNLVRLKIDASHISTLAAMPEVRYLSMDEPNAILNDSTTQYVQSGATNGGRPIHSRGIQGQNQIVAIGDSGVRADHQNFLGGIYGPTGNQAKIIVYYVPGDSPGELGDESESGYHGSHCAGTVLGDGRTGAEYGAYTVAGYDGHAYMAQLVMQDLGRTDDPDTPNVDEGAFIWTPSDMYNDYFGDAELTYGAKVHSNSWGGGLTYDDRTAEIDRYAWDSQDYNIVFAAGNAGADAYTIGSQAQAKNVIAVASLANNGGGISSFSSRGPATDGRIKPDIAAPGEAITSVDGGTTTNYKDLQGTSMACPAVAGSAALVRQYYTEGWYPTGAKLAANTHNPSAALIKATLINGANPLGQIPNMNEGWGRMHLENSLFFSGDAIRTNVVDNANGLLTGDYLEYTYSVQTGQRLKVTLVYTDYQGDPSAAKMLVNDLGLLVTVPGGATYRGNNFASGWSVPTTTANVYDTTNNIECVNIASPAAGVYTIRIDAHTIARGPQNFALVISGALTAGYGNVFMDRTVYDDTDTITIDVEDTNMAEASVTVTLSTSSGDSETVSVPVTATNSGLFKGGTINTALGYVNVGDGILQVFNGDIITATYSDPNPAHDAIAIAKVDLRGPTISNVHASGILGTAAIINWDTNENADSMVYYGTDPSSLTSTAYEDALAINHKVVLKNLTPNTVYYYDVESTDSRGRSTRDDNGGDHYMFSTPGASTGGNLVLLVDDDDGTLSTRGTPYELDWMNNLNHYGWTYTHWDFKVYDTPTLADMNSHTMVVWYVAEGYPQISAQDRTVLGQFLDQSVTPQGTPPMMILTGQDIGWDMADPGGTDVDVAWFEYYTRSRYLGDDADGGAGTEGGGNGGGGTDPFQVTNVGHPINIYGFNNIDLEEDAYSTSGGRFWPDDLTRLTGGGSAIAWDYNAHAYGGDASAVSQTLGGAAGAARIVFQGFAHDMIASTNNGANDYRPDLGEIDPERAGMLDQSIQWLLGGNHPSITLTYPTGGETVSGTISITWTVTGANSIDLYYSPNGGQLWNTLATGLAGTATSYSWNTAGLTTGTEYVVKVVATSTATYSDLTDYSVSGEFRIDGVDTKGPGCLAGSVTADKAPSLQGATMWYNATISDLGKGESNVVAAEYKLDDNTGAPGTWTAMTASTPLGITRSFTATYTGTLSIGNHVLYVRGKDSVSADANWGLISSATFEVIAAGTDNVPPYAPYNPVPADGATGVSLDPTLTVTVSDYDGDPMTVKFYTGAGAQIGTDQTGIASGGTASVVWSGRAGSTTYTWYATATDKDGTTQSATWSFTTTAGPQPPDQPFDNTPADGAIGVELNPTLSVRVTDPDGDPMTVTFHNAAGGAQIGADQTNVASGDIASVVWSGLSESTSYSWYAIADDNVQGATQSPTWGFTTGDFTPPAAPTVLTVDHWGPGDTTETVTEARYMRDDTHAVNGLTAYQLGLTQSATGTSNNVQQTGGAQNVVWGMRAWQRDSGGAVTELTGGAMTATVQRTANGGGIQQATWNCPETPFAETDSIVVRVYVQVGTGAVTELAAFTTEQMGATQLNSYTWTFYYYTQRETGGGGPNAFTRGTFWWGTTTYNSRITGIDYNTGVPGDPLSHNTLNWTHDGTDVAQYNIYRSDAEFGTYTALDNVPVGTNTYVDLDAGLYDGTRWWYIVRAQDAAANEELNTNAVQEPGDDLVTYDIDLTGHVAGDWVFVSFPVTLSENNIETVLNDAGGTDWDVAKWYDGTTKTWNTYRKGSGVNTFSTIDNTMGVWIRLTAVVDSKLTLGVQGSYPTATLNIPLYAGWNMVSYASATDRLASNTLPAEADMVAIWQATSPYILDQATNQVTMTHGNAYWVRVTADCIWAVEP